jgi:hypothetical protein
MKWLLLTLFFTSTLLSNEILNYRVIKVFFNKNSNTYLAIREFEQDKTTYFLAINTKNLKIEKIKKDNFTKIKSEKNLLNSIYKKALQNSKSIQNSGINKAYIQKPNNYYLTIDLCPSSKNGFEEELFKLLNKQKTDIAIALSIRWANSHKEEFEKLKNYKNLNITWINHTYNHYYKKNIPIEKNFLLLEGTDIESEILEYEKFMLRNNLEISPFIRYPGLVSDSNLSHKIVEKYSLIPIGSDTWLAKGQEIKPSSIILVHGNLNEKKGIYIFIKEYKDKKYNLSSLKEMFIK